MRTITALLVAGVLAGCTNVPEWIGGCELTQGKATGLWYTPVKSAECREAVNWHNENQQSDAEKGFVWVLVNGAWVAIAVLAN